MCACWYRSVNPSLASYLIAVPCRLFKNLHVSLAWSLLFSSYSNFHIATLNLKKRPGKIKFSSFVTSCSNLFGNKISQITFTTVWTITKYCLVWSWHLLYFMFLFLPLSAIFPFVSFVFHLLRLFLQLYYLSAYLVPPYLWTFFPSYPLSFLSPFCVPSFQAAYLLSLTPCPGCLGIDWLSPCHWSSLSILTRFGHPLRCGQRVGERGRYTRCSTAPGDKIKMNVRESKTKSDGEENDRVKLCVKQLVSNLIRLLHFGGKL